MKQIIYILIFLILTRCRLTNTEQYSRINKDTIADKVSDTTISNNKQITRNSSTEDNQTEEFRKQSLNGFEKATLYKLTDTIGYYAQSLPPLRYKVYHP